jgi:hypothetical protein
VRVRLEVAGSGTHQARHRDGKQKEKHDTWSGCSHPHREPTELARETFDRETECFHPRREPEFYEMAWLGIVATTRTIDHNARVPECKELLPERMRQRI